MTVQTPPPGAPHRRSSDQPRATYLSQNGTWIQAGLAIAVLIASITATAALVKAYSKGVAVESTLDTVQGNLETLTSAATDLTHELVGLKGDIKSLSEKVGGLQVNTTRTERDAQDHALKLAKVESDMDSMKARLTAAEGTIKALESRLISVEIAASHGSPPVAGKGGDGK